MLSCINQNYQIDGPQIGYTYGIFPIDTRYIGMVNSCRTALFEEQQRRREVAEEERRRQLAAQQERLRQVAEAEDRQRQAATQKQLAQVYGQWSLTTSDLCPGTHWEFSPGSVTLSPPSASDKPTTAQYEVRGNSVTVVNTYLDGRRFNVYLKIIDVDTMEMRGTGLSTVIRRCKTLRSSGLLRCAKEQVYDDFFAFSWYRNSQSADQYIDDAMKKIADIIKSGDLPSACKMVQELKQQIANKS